MEPLYKTIIAVKNTHQTPLLENYTSEKGYKKNSNLRK
jgi:hypothetical protein